MRTSIQAAPNVTPMIDVMLVLLILFMVVTPMMMDGFTVEPPNAANLREHPDDSKDVTLGIDAQGRYYLNKQPVDASALPSALRSIFTPERGDYVLYLKADRNLDYAKVLGALDVARNNGVTAVGMISSQPSQAR
jgi:biopolymer transport protein ExbD